MSDWREERRRDRLASAEITRADEAARTQARITQAEAAARLRREERQARFADRRAARRQRDARRAERMAWLNGHLLDLLFVPVIIVPAVLAWTAMAAYGDQVFGPAGWVLPAFSEGAMWAFAAATTVTRHRHPERPVWHLLLGTAAFAAVGAALNFIHGVTPAAGQVRGAGTGAVMALVSIAGVAAHQIVTAGPRRSRAERDAALLERLRMRRERRIQRVAVRRAAVELDADGNARLVHLPGIVTLTRRHGRAQLAVAPGPSPLTSSWPRPVPVFAAPAAASRISPGSASGDASGTALEVHPATPLRVHPAGAPKGASGMHPALALSRPKAALAADGRRPPRRGRRGVTEADAEEHFKDELAAGQIPSARRIARELHLRQDRAGELRSQMVQRMRERGVVPLERKQA
jgi:hypothetical protein